MYRRRKLEMQTIKVLIKFSKEDRYPLSDYFPEEQNEMMSWLNMAILECNKRRKQEEKAK
jgi:hypothetical protein